MYKVTPQPAPVKKIIDIKELPPGDIFQHEGINAEPTFAIKCQHNEFNPPFYMDLDGSGYTRSELTMSTYECWAVPKDTTLTLTLTT